MKSILTTLATFAAAAAFAGGAHNPPQDWFDETYANQHASTSGVYTIMSTSAGRWKLTTATDASVFSPTGVTIRTRSEENDSSLEFKPKSSGSFRPSVSNSFTTVTTKMTFTACIDGEEYWITNQGAHAAIALRDMGQDAQGNDLPPVFIGWHSLRSVDYWTPLYATGITPEANTFYDVTIETDYACSPIRVRYSVNGHILRDANGEEWFLSRTSAKCCSSVNFWGSGMAGEIVATEETPRTERAILAFANFTAKAGENVVVTNSATFTTNETSNITGDLTYAWYLTDASGLRTETAFATGAACTLTADAYGHWVTVEASDDNGYVAAGKFWCSALPVAYIDVENGAWPSYKKEEHAATMFLSTATDGKAEYDGDITIHVRGNSTATAAKKPYKIKLDTTTNLFGLGQDKNKHWVLLANYFDESLMRNKITYDLSEAFGLDPVMHSTWIDIVMNGEFVGCYQLCEHIRVGEDRINILDWDSGKIAKNTVEIKALGYTDEDETILGDYLETNCLWMTTGKFSYRGTNFVITAKKKEGGTLDSKGNMKVYWKNWNGGDITGGYIFELDSKKTTGDEESISSVPSYCEMTNTTSLGQLLVCLAMNTPEYAFTNPKVMAYCTNLWWQISCCALSPTGFNANGRHYTDYIAQDTLVGYWLSQYVSANLSILSRYSYQDVGKKMVFGPAWDFDHALGSLQVSEAYTVDEYGQIHYVHGTGSANPEYWGGLDGNRQILGSWTADPYFSYAVRKRYWAARQAIEDIIKDGGTIDQYRELLASSAKANDLKWNNRIGFADKACEKGDVTVLKEFFRDHVAWIDEQFATVASAVTSATATVPNEFLRYARKNMTITFTGSRPNPKSVETKIPDVLLDQNIAGYDGTVTLGANASGAAKLLVYVNGQLVQTVDVAGTEVPFHLPNNAVKSSDTNFISFLACKENGSVAASDVALLCRVRARGATFMIR